MQAQKIQVPIKYDMFLDVSGSVHGSPNYFDTSKQIFQLYAADVRNYYFWDHQLLTVPKKEFQDFINAKVGRGGNQLTLIAKEIIAKDLKNIILITDGEVSDSDVQNTDKIMGDYKLNKSICYIVSNKYCNEVNMSVTCPFTRKCENQVFKKQNNTPMQTVVQFTPQDYQILDTLDTITLQNFQAEYEKIQGLIIALNMGKEGNIPLKNNLVIMKNRLIKQLAKKSAKQQKKQLSQIIREHLQKGQFLPAIQQMNKVCKGYFSNVMTTDLQKNISHLINLCGDLRGKYNINQIKSNKMATAQTAQQGVISTDVQINDLSKNPIQCPILMDQDVPQILVDQCEPILLGVEKYIVDDIAACPLRLLNYPEVRAKLKSKLSNYVGVMGIKANFDDKLLKNPFTQARLLGSIPLGTHHSHVKVGNHTIAKLISGGKILGNLNMYYAVIWYLIHEGQIEYLKDIEKNATEHLTFRLKNSNTYASLCGQAQFVTTQINTDIAIWFCVNSGFLNQPTDRDTFRFHFYNIEPMIKITEVLGYPNDKGLIPHYNRTKNLMFLLSIYKKLTTNSDKKTFKNMLHGLYQNGIFVKTNELSKKFTELEICSQFVPLDGPASEEQVKKIRALYTQKYKFTEPLTNQELFYIGNIVDPQKSASAYVLDYNFVAPELPTAKISWKYGVQYSQDVTKVCPKTLRPYFYINEKTWQQVVFEKWNMKKEEVFSHFKQFEAFLVKYETIPTYEELILFFYNRYVEGSKKTTLPFLTEKWTKDLIAQYTPLIEKLEIKQINKILEATRQIEARKKTQTGI